MIGAPGPALGGPGGVKAVAVLLELEGGQLIRFKLRRPVELRAGMAHPVIRAALGLLLLWLTTWLDDSEVSPWP